jgi:probable phosphoglycerate mutase
VVECWLVRHGESTWNSVGRFQGGLDAPLSPRGLIQAQALAAGLAATRFDGLYTSPLRRARDTATVCRATLGLEPVAMDDLREVGLGDWEGLTLETVLAQDGERYRRWVEAPVDHPAPGGEPMAGLAGRVRAALDELCRRHPDGRVLVVSHGGAISSALCGWLGQPLNAIWSLRLDNASITRVLLPAGRLLAWNETSHLASVAAAAVIP